MNRLTRATGSRAGRARLGLLCGLLAAALTGAAAAPALADGHDYGHHDDRGHYDDRGHHDDRGHRGPPPRYIGPSYQGYYQQPNVYYSAPPVVYQPPGASINFSIPLFR
ncbi:MAG TPA: hypothetical protein VNE67_17035 [Acetobacteraceae bacterium]|nr:hypothetical protein [Acetobacteraceae bacterium]